MILTSRPKIPPAMTETLATKAYAVLRTKLASGELKPGDRLVNRTLAEQIGMSFTPVREAINQLASEGLVEYRRGAGAFVRNLDVDEFAELYDVREHIEAFAARRAATNASPAELAELESVCGRGTAIVDRLVTRGDAVLDDTEMDEWLEAEEAFHGAVIRAAHNRWVAKIVGELRIVSRVFAPHRDHRDLLTPETAQRSWDEHVQLVRFLRDRDANAASKCMAEHVGRGRENVLPRMR
ncbi:MAG: GntR family transcriptional regulator [bacterium]|nr:GntR family transcriptional regulator [bacterium]